jgi:hypothetical protein
LRKTKREPLRILLMMLLAVPMEQVLACCDLDGDQRQDSDANGGLPILEQLAHNFPFG